MKHNPWPVITLETEEVKTDSDSNGRYLQYLIYIAYLYHIIDIEPTKRNIKIKSTVNGGESIDENYIIKIIDSKSVNRIKWKEIRVKELEQHLNKIKNVFENICVADNINSLEIIYYEEEAYKKLTAEDQNITNKDLHDQISEIPCKSSSVKIKLLPRIKK